jgi:hypothetical protein
MKAFYEQTVLLDQPYVKDDSKTIQQLPDEIGAKVGEKVAFGDSRGTSWARRAGRVRACRRATTRARATHGPCITGSC